MGERTSRLRQQLLQAAEQHQAQIEELLGEDAPLFRGSFGTRARVCGNPGCHCAQGERHESKYLTATDGGKVRQVHVPAADEARVAAGVERYRRFRALRRKLASLGERQLELVDELGLSLLGAYPPNDPLPAPTRRGRKVKHGTRRG